MQRRNFLQSIPLLSGIPFLNFKRENPENLPVIEWSEDNKIINLSELRAKATYFKSMDEYSEFTSKHRYLCCISDTPIKYGDAYFKEFLHPAYLLAYTDKIIMCGNQIYTGEVTIEFFYHHSSEINRSCFIRPTDKSIFIKTISNFVYVPREV